MKTMILVAAVAAFEFAFIASIATPPSGPVAERASVQPRSRPSTSVAQRGESQIPCTPPG
jgi:hypothetical protein